MLDQRRRRWSNIEATLGECLCFLGVITEGHLTIPRGQLYVEKSVVKAISFVKRCQAIHFLKSAN